MKLFSFLLVGTLLSVSAADRPLGRLPDGTVYIVDEVAICLRAEIARGLSRADSLRQPVPPERLTALHPAFRTVVARHLSAKRWLKGEPLPTALRHTGAEVPKIARSLTALLKPGADARDVVEKLRTLPEIEWATLSTLQVVALEPNDNFFHTQWGPQRINCTNAWDVPQAATTLRVAIVDTGVDLVHQDLSSRIVYEEGFAGNTNGDAMRDKRGGNSIDHGTHVAGIAAAVRNNGYGIAGVAEVGIMAMGCAVWDSGENEYHIGDAAAAINDAVANDAAVINCSFSLRAPLSPDMQSALDAAQNLGVLVVCGAGNDGTNVLTSPSAGWAAHLWPVLVSNIQSDDTLRPSSNYGFAIHFGAPGTDIYSTVTTNYSTPPHTNASAYATMGGTSMAAPHVAGAAAMVRSMNAARIAGAGTKDLLYRMAEDLGDPGIDPTFGFGMLRLQPEFLQVLKNAATFAGTNGFPYTPDGSYDSPYPAISSALAGTAPGGTIVLNGGIGGVSPAYPPQAISAPVTLSAFPDRPVTIGQ